MYHASFRPCIPPGQTTGQSLDTGQKQLPNETGSSGSPGRQDAQDLPDGLPSAAAADSPLPQPNTAHDNKTSLDAKSYVEVQMPTVATLLKNCFSKLLMGSPAIQSDKNRKGSDVVTETDPSQPVAVQVCEGKPASQDGDDPLGELHPKKASLVDQSELVPPGEVEEQQPQAKATDEEFKPQDPVQLAVEEQEMEEKDKVNRKSPRKDGGMSEAAGGSLMGGLAEELSHANLLTDDRATTDDRALRAAPYTLISQFLSLVSSDDDSVSDDDASDAQRKSRSRPSPTKDKGQDMQPSGSGSAELARPQSLNNLLTTLYEKRRGACILRQIQDNGEKIQEKINARDFGYRRRDLLAHELSKDTLSDVASVHSAKSDQTGSHVSPDHKRPVVCALDELQRVPPRQKQKPLRSLGAGVSCPSGQSSSTGTSPPHVCSTADLEGQSPVTKTETKTSDAEQIPVSNSSKEKNDGQLASGVETVDASDLMLPSSAAGQSFDISAATGTEGVPQQQSHYSIPTTSFFARNLEPENERNEPHGFFLDQLNLPELVEPPPLSPLQHDRQSLAFVLPTVPAYRTALHDELTKPCQKEDLVNSSVGVRERRDSADGESLRVILSELHSFPPEKMRAAAAADDVQLPSAVCTDDKRTFFHSSYSTDKVFPEKHKTFSSLKMVQDVDKDSADKLQSMEIRNKNSDLNETALCSNNLDQVALTGRTDIVCLPPNSSNEKVISSTGCENVVSSCHGIINDMVTSPDGRLKLPSGSTDMVHELLSGDGKSSDLIPSHGDVVEIPPNCPVSADASATVVLAKLSNGAATVSNNRPEDNVCEVRPVRTEVAECTVRAAFRDEETHAKDELSEHPSAGSQRKSTAAPGSSVSCDLISQLPTTDVVSNKNSGVQALSSSSQHHDPDLIPSPSSVSTENKEKMERKQNLTVPSVNEADKSELETKKTSSRNSDEPFGDISSTSTSDELLSSRQMKPSRRKIPLIPGDLVTCNSVRRSSNPHIYKIQASFPERALLAKPQKASDEPLGDISSTSDELSSRQNAHSKRKVPLIPVDLIVHGYRRSSNPHIHKIQTSSPDNWHVARSEKVLPATPSSPSTSSSSSSSSRRRILPSCAGKLLSVGRNGLVEQKEDSSSSPRQPDTLPDNSVTAQVPRPPIGPISQEAIIAARARSVVFLLFVISFFCCLS